MACKAKNIYHLTLCRTRLLTLVWSDRILPKFLPVTPLDEGLL